MKWQTSALWSQTSEMLENNESTSLVIVLVKVFCACSWFILKYFNGLVYYGSSKVSKNQLGKRSKLFRSRHVGPSSILGWYPADWPASWNSKTTVSSGAFTKKNLGNFLQRQCVGYGVKFYYVFLCELSKSVHRSEYEPNSKVSRAY